MGELAPHSEALGSIPEVNHGVVYQNSVFLPGEASLPGFVRFKTTAEDGAALSEMSMLRSEESAESIVVVSESVSNRRRVTRPVKSAASRCGRRLEPKKRKQPEVACG